MLLLLLAFALPARAQQSVDTDDTVKQAGALFRLGRERFDAGDYEAASDAFERAYALSPRPPLLYNIGLAALKARHPVRALQAFEAYCAAVPPSPERKAVQKQVAELQRAGVSDGGERPFAPGRVGHESTAPPVAAGGTTAGPVVTAPPSPAVTAAPPLLTSPTGAAPAPAAALTRQPPSRPPVTHRAWFWATLATGAVVVGGAVALGIVLGSHKTFPSISGVAIVQ